MGVFLIEQPCDGDRDQDQVSGFLRFNFKMEYENSRPKSVIGPRHDQEILNFDLHFKTKTVTVVCPLTNRQSMTYLNFRID